MAQHKEQDYWEKAQALLEKTEVPYLPQELIQLQQELQSRYPNTVTIANLISHNPELLHAFLDFVNQHHHLDPPVQHAKTAVDLLGIEEIANLYLASALISQIAQSKAERAMLSREARAALACAELSYWIPEIQRGEAYVLGLSQNIGALFMQRVDASYLKAFYLPQINHPYTAYKDELTHYQTAHTYVGSIIGKHWHMEKNLLQTVRYHHHRPDDPTLSSNPAIQRRVALIHLANYIVVTTLGEAFLTEELKESLHLAQKILELPDIALRAATSAVLKWGKQAHLVNASH